MLSEVRYVAELRNNLIFLTTLQANGYLFQLDRDKDIMRISKGVITVMTTMRTVGNIYKLLWDIIMDNLAFVKTDKNATKLWHMNFGYLSERWMMELHKRNLLKGVRSCTIGLCKYIVLGKQCSVHLKIGKYKTKGLLYYVHYDVWGPTKEPSWRLQVLCDIH